MVQKWDILEVKSGYLMVIVLLQYWFLPWMYQRVGAFDRLIHPKASIWTPFFSPVQSQFTDCEVNGSNSDGKKNGKIERRLGQEEKTSDRHSSAQSFLIFLLILAAHLSSVTFVTQIFTLCFFSFMQNLEGLSLHAKHGSTKAPRVSQETKPYGHRLDFVFLHLRASVSSGQRFGYD